ncbi:MAG: serine--tRNA ligase, partial [Planctomycetaceae bacterium]|nr:serine--tRNA ligase [Planctomycetaceae bacterium]
MLDRRFIVENHELVAQNCQRRGVDADVDRLVELELQRRDLDKQVQELNQQANQLAKSVGKASAEERAALIEQGRQVREQVDATKKQQDQLEEEILGLQNGIPNLTHPDAPVGDDDQANLEVRRGKTERPQFDFQPKDHVALGESLDMIDFEGGARVPGAGFYFLRNDAVRLELALQQYALQTLTEAGFTPVITPDLAYTEILHGTGYIPRGPETQIYSIENTNLNLVATAEITLGGMYANHVFEADQLPLKLCGISHCFRTEAGAAGRASRGLYRVHQFTKVEMFAFTLPEQSDATLEEFCDLECRD